MAAGLLLPPYSKSCNGREVAALLGILLLDFALRKGLLRGRSVWGKCQNPCLYSWSSGHLAGAADDLFCCSISLAAHFHGDALLETCQPRSMRVHFLEKASQFIAFL